MVTGHSLGAAQAILYSLRLLKICDDYKLCVLDTVYTFCAPRVGNEAFTELYNSIFETKNIKVFRVVNGQDIVP